MDTEHLIQQVLDHEDFKSYFCEVVDPICLLSVVKIRDAHKEVVQRKNSLRRDDANMELLHRVKCERGWKPMLLQALERTGYLEIIRSKLYSTEGVPAVPATPATPAAPAVAAAAAATKDVWSEPEKPAVEFKSKFFDEFDFIGYLGAGGFGKVFEAKHKVDATHYAIKRIHLRSGKEGTELVLREVRALVELTHNNIVRYYNSWWEEPPAGWWEEKDRELLAQDGESSHLIEDTSPDLTSASSHQKSPPAVPRGAGQGRAGLNIQLGLEEDLDIDGVALVAASEFSEYSSSSSSGQPGCTWENLEESTGRTGGLQSAPNADQLVGDHAVEQEPVEEQRVAADSRKVDEGAGDAKPGPMPRKYLFIQMELCEKETLKEWLQDNSNRNSEIILGFFRQIANAVGYIHSQGRIHRDLKPSNVFFGARDGRLKIGDFGLVKEAAIQAEAEAGGVGRRAAEHTAKVGTDLYMSPELIQGGTYDVKVDIFSLGIILYELLVSFGTETERRICLGKVKKLEFPGNFQEEKPRECELLKRMLSKDPKARPTAEEILSHPLLRSTPPP